MIIVKYLFNNSLLVVFMMIFDAHSDLPLHIFMIKGWKEREEFWKINTMNSLGRAISGAESWQYGPDQIRDPPL